MKTKKLLAITLILVTICTLLAACGETGGETTGETAAEVTIVGEWASKDYGGSYVYTFKDDGTGNYDAAGVDMPFTYTAEDGKLSILYEGNTAPFESEYTLEGKTLTMKDSLGDDVIYNRK